MSTAWAFIEAPNTVQFRLEGCRNDGNPTLISGSNTLPNIDSNFTCQDPSSLGGNDTPYTPSNLGKGWNELDLVPYRLITENSNNGGTVTYDVLIAADNADINGVMGYDQIVDVQIIQAPDTVNLFSDNSCEVEVGEQMIDTSGTVTGGIEDVIFRQLTITQNAGTTCVIDWANRLAIGASQFPGSSLQAYMFESEDFQKGKRTVSIPVKDIVASGIRKDMTASSGAGVVWNVTKGVDPAFIDLGNTCDETVDNSAEVKIRVEWSVIPSSANSVRVVTNIYVSNSASRAVLADIEDDIFGDIGAGEQLLDNVLFEDVLVPAKSEVFVTHTFEINAQPEEVSGLRDVASATLKDPDLENSPPFSDEPLVVEFTLQDAIQIINGEGDTTAIISDTERLTGSGLSYFVSQVTGANGTFSDSYQLNDILTPSDNDLIWQSEDQNPVECANDNGCLVNFVEFTKTISAAALTSTDGTLSDWALLEASDGTTAISGTEESPVSINITSSALVDLDIQLTVPELDAPDTLQCTVEVKNSSNQVISTLTFDFDSNANDITQTLDDIAPDSYTATVTSCGSLVGNTMDSINLTTLAEPADCFGKLAFVLTEPEPVDPVLVAVDKVTLPEGEENGWTMTLNGPNTGPDGIILITSDSAPSAFEKFQGQDGDFELVEGSYTITETQREGWAQTASSGCEFTVSLPEDAGTTKQCSITNKKLGTIIINKLTKPKYGMGFSFLHNIDETNEFTLDHGQSKVFVEVLPGSYQVEEADPNPDFALLDLSCTETVNGNSQVNVMTRIASIELDPDETVECTYINRENGMVVVKKFTNGYSTNDVWKFTLSGPELNSYALTPPNVIDFNGAKLTPKTPYTLCEVGVPYGWQPVWKVDSNNDGYADEVLFLDIRESESSIDYYLGASRVYNPNAGQQQLHEGNSEFCVNFIVKPGQTLVFAIDNIQFVKTKEPQPYPPKEECYDKPIYGQYLSDDHVEASNYKVGHYYVDSCDKASELLGRDAYEGSSDYVAVKLLNAQLHHGLGQSTCYAADIAMKNAQRLLEGSGYAGEGYNLSYRERRDALILARELDKYTANMLCR
ncbi:hypothetical protein [Photobacterium minamisatsumaniensis]|uniref:hypothetical protein n=1 Tax=Photobacterium minamisatsumaniensis TaxID=2910233 RepID=UPI003D10E272